ncbi:MAG: alanine racemase [Rhizobiaceae bacterium]
MTANVPELIATSRLTVDVGAIVRNWQRLHAFVPRSAVAAVVKADAYGMGLEKTVVALAGAGCAHFFVATPDEGLQARKTAPGAEVFVLAGLTRANAPIYQEAGLIPVLNSLEDIVCWAERCRETGNRRPCALHVDTGMNRLGLTLDEAKTHAGDEKQRHSITPILIMSHLACADDPGDALTGGQVSRFEMVRALFPGTPASLANSAGTISGIGKGMELARPGIALYGAQAVNGTLSGMEPVAQFEARILQVRQVEKGEGVGYGAAFAAQRDSVIATIGAGYADGILRSASGSGVPLRQLSGGAEVWLAGYMVPIVGRVSMDSCALDVSNVPQAVLEKAEWVELFGHHIAVDAFAAAAGTIGYEALTGIGRRANRKYLND